MFGRGMLTAVLEIRPDIKGLKRDLEKDLPKAVRDATRGAEREATRGFKRVGDEAGDQIERGIEKGIDDGVREGARDAARDAKSRFRKVGEEAGKSIGDGIEKEVEKSAHRTGTTVSKSLSGWGDKMVKTGAVMTAGLALPATILMKSSADMAMEHEDNLGALEQMYKAGFGRINKWIENEAGKMQLSQATAASGAMSLSGYMTGMFGPTEEAAAAAEKYLERLADAAAFYGGDIEDKIAAFASAMNGSFEPLETQFAGTAMRMSEVAEHASKMGLLTVDATKLQAANLKVAEAEQKLQKLRKEGKTGTLDYEKAQNQLNRAKDEADKISKGAVDSMSQEVRWLATADLWYQKTAPAMGAVNRERETATGQMREAKKEWDDMKLALGQGLLPVIAELAPRFAELFRSMADKGVFDRLIPAIETLADALALALELFTKLPSGVQSAIMGLALFGGPALTLLGTVTKLTGALGGLARTLGVVGSAGSAAGGGLAGGAGLGMAGRVGLGAAGIGMLYQGFATGDKNPSNWQLIGGATATGAAIGGPIGAAIGAAVGVGGAVGRAIDDRGWLGFDEGGVMPGQRGVHAPALVAGGETVVPTHKYPAGEALARVGLAPDTSALEASIAALAARPSNVTVVAPPGMDLHGLAREIDKLRRGSESLVLRPRANRRPA